MHRFIDRSHVEIEACPCDISTLQIDPRSPIPAASLFTPEPSPDLPLAS
jgi:hypothetical protein